MTVGSQKSHLTYRFSASRKNELDVGASARSGFYLLDEQWILTNETHHGGSQLILPFTHGPCDIRIGCLTSPHAELFFTGSVVVAS